MMDDKSAFSTPELVHIADLAHARSQELHSLLEELGHRQDKHRTALQILPRYMRRRAASYNIKRLPRSLRPLADPKTGSAKKKRPSRRHRRRPRDLLAAYANRQRKVKWLKTHIWHAKRFHMNTLWNYRLAQRSNTKSIRPTYKSLKDRCLLHDMSYISCIELEGIEQDIIDRLHTFLPLKSKMHLNGQFEGQYLVYKPNTKDCLTPISFMWMPRNGDHDRRKLWLWCHPASYDDLVGILRQLLENPGILSTEEPPNKKQKNDFDSSSITMKLLRDEQQLARFRLVGPLALDIIRHALHPSLMPKESYDKKEAPSAWWTEQAHSKDIYEQQLQFWNEPSTTIMPNRIVSIVVRDPRVFKPVKPKASIRVQVNNKADSSLSIDLASSPLWNEQSRSHSSEHRLATYQINLRRSNLDELKDDESQIPLILIHHHDLLTPLGSKTDFGSGWDIILPNEWSQIIWIALVYSGARPIGQDELSLISHETGEFQFPQEYPDTDAGVLWTDMVEKQRLTDFSMCPPSKRPNFLINGIRSPFRTLWTNIVRDWALFCEPSIQIPMPYRFHVLRDRRTPTIEMLKEHLHTLVPVRIECKGRRGVIDHTTLIFLPTTDDLKSVKQEIVESRHVDQARIEERKLKKNEQSFRKGQAMVKLIEDQANNFETSIIDDCDRKLLGAVTSGAFQFLRACCTGKGFIATGALITLLTQQQQKNEKQKQQKRLVRVLIRTTTSQYYRWATLQF